MNKKVIIGIIIFLIFIVVIFINKKGKETINISEQNKMVENNYYEWIEDEERYVVYGDDGKIRGYAKDKYELEKFEDDPDLYFESFPEGYFDENDMKF